LWITRINAASRQYGLSYSKLIDGMNKAGIGIDRKMLANLAVESPDAFEQIANQARAAL
jgi:large subunit ribosomal protein L20